MPSPGPTFEEKLEGTNRAWKSCDDVDDMEKEAKASTIEPAIQVQHEATGKYMSTTASEPFTLGEPTIPLPMVARTSSGDLATVDQVAPSTSACAKEFQSE